MQNQPHRMQKCVRRGLCLLEKKKLRREEKETNSPLQNRYNML